MTDNGITIQTGDFRTLGASLAGESVDLILTDPPYPAEYLPLWGDLGALAARVLKPGGFLVAYSGQLWLDEVIAMLREHLTWYWQDILLLPGGKSRVNGRKKFQEFKPVLVYVKEPFKRIREWGPDIIVSPAPSKRYHEWGQSLAPIKELVGRYSNPGDLVCDPFLGGGTTALACLLTGRRCIGYELDPETADIARHRIERERLFVPPAGPLQLDFDTAGQARCETCGALLPSNGHGGRPRRFCSNRCRQLAYRNRQAAALQLEVA
jgi:DNA modification methylase